MERDDNALWLRVRSGDADVEVVEILAWLELLVRITAPTTAEALAVASSLRPAD